MHKADTILKTLLNLQAGYPMATEVHYKARKKCRSSNPNLIRTRAAVEKQLLKGKVYKDIQIFAKKAFIKFFMTTAIWTFSNTYLGNSMFPKSRVHIK